MSFVYAAETDNASVIWLGRSSAQELPTAVVVMVRYEQYR